jgi:hypothetical protein
MDGPDSNEDPIIAQNVKAINHRHTATDMATEAKDCVISGAEISVQWPRLYFRKPGHCAAA